MEAESQRGEVALRMIVTATVMLLVFFAGGRTRWSEWTRTAADAGAASVSAATLPDTGSLIDEAVARGELDEETGLVYRVFALYGDERLPAAYQAGSMRELDSGVLCDVTERWSDLSAKTQAILAPFLALPAAGDAGRLDCAN